MPPTPLSPVLASKADKGVRVDMNPHYRWPKDSQSIAQLRLEAGKMVSLYDQLVKLLPDATNIFTPIYPNVVHFAKGPYTHPNALPDARDRLIDEIWNEIVYEAMTTINNSTHWDDFWYDRVLRTEIRMMNVAPWRFVIKPLIDSALGRAMSYLPDFRDEWVGTFYIYLLTRHRYFSSSEWQFLLRVRKHCDTMNITKPKSYSGLRQYIDSQQSPLAPGVETYTRNFASVRNDMKLIGYVNDYANGIAPITVNIQNYLHNTARSPYILDKFLESVPTDNANHQWKHIYRNRNHGIDNKTHIC